MRSSIACRRCRKSKIKCFNAGVNTRCRACESSNRECVYPPPAGGLGGVKRDIGTAAVGDGDNVEWNIPKRSRPRRSIGMSSSAKDAAKICSVEALVDPSILTVKAWEAIVDIFQSHFATMLPFLHPTSFLNQIRQFASVYPSSSSSSTGNGKPKETPTATSASTSKPEPSPLLLLGILALTARLHPRLVAHHCPSTASSPSNPLVASEFYARALRTRLADTADVSTDITRVQALLMLTLHEWSMDRGKSAWIQVGIAIRLMQAMGLIFELENDVLSPDAHRSSSIGVAAFKPEQFGDRDRDRDRREQTSDDVIVQEMKRRTFWACFILDRCLSTGKYRPRMIHVKDLNIQLPSENAFAFGERVCTSQLNDPSGCWHGSQSIHIPSIRHSLSLGDENIDGGNAFPDSRAWSPPISRRKESLDEDIDRWEIGAEESVLSRTIRCVHIWGSILKWSCAGGRKYVFYKNIIVTDGC